MAQATSSEVSILKSELDCILGYPVSIYSSDMGELSKGEWEAVVIERRITSDNTGKCISAENNLSIQTAGFCISMDTAKYPFKKDGIFYNPAKTLWGGPVPLWHDCVFEHVWHYFLSNVTTI